MAEVKLKATRRDDVGKGGARKTRASGRVPAVLYGPGVEPVSISVDRREFGNALHTEAGMNVLLGIEIDGRTTLALTREIQRDPVKGTVLHADFLNVDRTSEIDVDVPVHLIGEAAGVSAGGALEHPLFVLHVTCRPTEVPEAIEVDVSTLAIGDSIRVADLPPSDRYEVLTDPDTIVAHVAAPISETELEEMEAAAGIVTEEAVSEREITGTAAPEGAGTDEPTPEES